MLARRIACTADSAEMPHLVQIVIFETHLHGEGEAFVSTRCFYARLTTSHSPSAKNVTAWHDALNSVVFLADFCKEADE